MNVDTSPHCLIGRCYNAFSGNSAYININRDRQPSGGNINASTPGKVSGSPNPIDSITIGAMHASSAYQNFGDFIIQRILILAPRCINSWEVNRYASWSADFFGTV